MRCLVVVATRRGNAQGAAATSTTACETMIMRGREMVFCRTESGSRTATCIHTCAWVQSYRMLTRNTKESMALGGKRDLNSARMSARIVREFSEHAHSSIMSPRVLSHPNNFWRPFAATQQRPQEKDRSGDALTFTRLLGVFFSLSSSSCSAQLGSAPLLLCLFILCRINQSLLPGTVCCYYYYCSFYRCLLSSRSNNHHSLERQESEATT